MQWFWLAMMGCAEPGAVDTGAPQVEGYADLGGGLVLGWAQTEVDERVGYVCGEGDRVHESRWFRGWDDLPATDDTAWVLSLDAQGWALTDPEGARTAGSYAPYADDGTSGMYFAYTGCASGVVVQRDRAVGHYCDGLGVVAQVEPVGTLVAVDGVLKVQAILSSGNIPFDATRMTWSD